MKKRYFLGIIMSAFLFVLTACGGGESYEAEAINEDTDVCDVCAMMVPDNQHATQIVTTEGKVLKFDDIGCLHEWKEDQGEDKIGAEFVRDYNTEEWIELKSATFAYHEDFMTPMAYGVYSFKDKADAEQLVEDEGMGEILNADALASHEWEMNMDHDDHDEVETN